MNIQKLEAVLEEMRGTTLADVEAAIRVRNWADRIGDAVTEHLIAELEQGAVPASGASDLATTPGGHDWDDSSR